MGVCMLRARGIDGWVICYRQRCLALALLQCLFFTNFTHTIGAASYHANVAAELHRSTARYRQLRELDISQHDVDEQMMKENVEDELNLDVNRQQQEMGVETNTGQEPIKFDVVPSPAEPNLDEDAHVGQQEQGGSKEHVGHEFNKFDELGSPTLNSSQFGQQKQRKFGGDVEHEVKKVERSTSEHSDAAPDPDQHRPGRLEKELGHTEEPTNEIPGNNPEVDQEQSQTGLKQGVELELDTIDQQQEQAQEAAEERTTDPLVFPDPYLLGPTIQDWDEQRSSWLKQNPGMKSPLSKPRVLIVTGSQPKPCRSPDADAILAKSFKLKMDYARMHGFEIYYNFVWLDPLFGGWWVKLPTLRKLMLTHPEIEWFLWVDSDAVFTDMLFEPPFDTYEGYNMVMWAWEDGLLINKNWVAFNAGVFFIRNCQWSLDLIDKWSPMGAEGAATYVYGKLFTSFLSSRHDFPSDDQSALAYLIITDEAVRSKVKLVDSQFYFISAFWIDVIDTFENCAEKYHPGLGDQRWPWITHFTGCGFCHGGSNPDYAHERCIEAFTRAYNFADNQVLAYMGYQHQNLSSEVILPTRQETDRPIELVGVNPWRERIAELAAAAEATSP